MNVLHLNPIFQAGTNHRYGAIDYHQIDLLLGDTWVLRQLADELYHGGMHIISDGVFDHCGDNFQPFLDVVQTGVVRSMQIDLTRCLTRSKRNRSIICLAGAALIRLNSSMPIHPYGIIYCCVVLVGWGGHEWLAPECFIQA